MRQAARAWRESARSTRKAPARSAAVQKLSRPSFWTRSWPNDSSSPPTSGRAAGRSVMTLLLRVEQRPQLRELLLRELRVLGEEVERGGNRAAERLAHELRPGGAPRLDGFDGR